MKKSVVQQLPAVPFAITQPEAEGLQYLAVEVSYAGTWVNLNDNERYIISAENTRDNSQKSWRKITASSPILGGDYLVHAVPNMITETIAVWVHGGDQTNLADNFFLLGELFEQFEYTIRWTFNEYREYWRCQLAEASMSRGQVWTHSQMALCAFQVPRYPEVTRERIA